MRFDCTKINLKDIKPNFLLGILFFLLFLSGSCDKQSPPDVTELLWQIPYSYTIGNDPTASGGLSINTSGWRNVYITQASYNFQLSLVENKYMPSDNSLDMSTLSKFRQTVNSFIKKFEENWGYNISILEQGSHLFGVNDMIGAGTGVVGATAPKHFTQDDPAVAFVFTSKILNLSGLTAQQKWALVDYTVLHELGHSRGLNAETGQDPYYDHNNHSGEDSANCIMKLPIGYTPPEPFVFCDYHKKVLKNCLKVIKMSYLPSETCAQ